MERQSASFVRFCLFQLAVKRFGADSYPHGRDFKSATEGVIIEHNVAVERPVVIVRRPAVVLYAGFQLAADLHYEGRAVILYIGVFALFRSVIGIHILKLLRRHKRNVS